MVTLITGKQKHAIRHGSMDTVFTLSENGNLNASTRVRNRSRFRELVGGVIVLLLDGNRHPLWSSHARRYRVEGCWIGECDRTYGWADDVPLEILSRVRGYSILQNQDIHWQDMLGQRRPQFAQWLYSDDGKETLNEIQRTATMLKETDALLLQML